MIRLVTFDALHTLITPRKPIHVQYAEEFRPYLGNLPPKAIARSFKLALQQLQAERPSYRAGAANWWGEVISRTAVGAGADLQAVERHLGTIVPSLMKRFSSRKGYRLFDDSLITLDRLRAMGVRTGLITNSDARIADVLEDLGASEYLSPMLISEVERVEKPSLSIFLTACARGGATPPETLHVGDDLREDYIGADNAGLNALLLRRKGQDGEEVQKGAVLDFRTSKSLDVVEDLYGVLRWVDDANKTHKEYP